MIAKAKVISFRVRDADWRAFQSFMENVNLKPYGVLRMIIETYAAGERLRTLLKSNQIDELEAAAELGRVAERVRGYFQVNGAFMEALRSIARHYNLNLGV